MHQIVIYAPSGGTEESSDSVVMIINCLSLFFGTWGRTRGLKPFFPLQARNRRTHRGFCTPEDPAGPCLVSSAPNNTKEEVALWLGTVATILQDLPMRSSAAEAFRSPQILLRELVANSLHLHVTFSFSYVYVSLLIVGTLCYWKLNFKTSCGSTSHIT